MTTCIIQQKRRCIQHTPSLMIMSQARRRKNIFIDQERIDRVRTLLRADSETETIDRALTLAEDYARFEAEVMAGLTSLGGRGGVVDHFSPKRRLK